jgi:recombination protein RecA
MYGRGISRAGEVLDLAVEHGIIQKSGSWFSYEGTKLGQGRDTVKDLIEDNAEMQKEIEAKLKDKLNSGQIQIAEDTSATEE